MERFNRTLLEEWAYARLYRSNTERRRAFRRWLRSYNHRRPHTSLDGLRGPRLVTLPSVVVYAAGRMV
jgi:transposase InsO family protein